MRNSFRLGAVSGIPIGLHWSIALIAGLFGMTLAGTILPAAAPGYVGAAYLLTAAAVTVALLGSIVAHELGHSIVAQRNDVGVASITLFALGGVARLDQEPKTAGAAARIALAGPAVSVAIGIGALLAAAAAGTVGTSALIVAGLTWLGLVNLSLAVFNMLPALPLDGGRALQAALWQRSGDRDQATISAASVGRYIGWAIVAFGAWRFLNGGAGLWTMLIGWFIVGSAKAEGLRARFQVAKRQWAPPQWPGTTWPDSPGSEAPYPGPPWPSSPRSEAPHPGAAWPDRSVPPRPSTWQPPVTPTDIVEVEGRRVD